MPVCYRLDPKRRLVVTTAEGRVSFADITDHQSRLLGDPAYDATFDQLIDATAATDWDLSAEETRHVADRRLLSPSSRRAFVASQPVIYGMGRLMQVYHERHARVQVFRDMESALKWLGIED